MTGCGGIEDWAGGVLVRLPLLGRVAGIGLALLGRVCSFGGAGGGSQGS